MTELAFTVVGTPAPQGSKSAFKHKTTGNIVVTESGHKKVKSWREDVKAAAADAITATSWVTPSGAVRVTVTFYLSRPAGHYGTGRNAGRLKPTAPAYCPTRPDLDKTVRSTLDALTAVRAFHDDSRVVILAASKRYADDRPTGAEIAIEALREGLW